MPKWRRGPVYKEEIQLRVDLEGTAHSSGCIVRPFCCVQRWSRFLDGSAILLRWTTRGSFHPRPPRPPTYRWHFQHAQ